MTSLTKNTSPQSQSRIAGILYLAIIIFGIWSEGFIRSVLIVPGDAAATAANILASDGTFILSFVADTIMVLCDVALAILLYALFKPVSKTLAFMAAAFRLVQAAVLAVNLLNQWAAISLLYCVELPLGFSSEQVQSLALFFLELQSYGYDLGLLFFGINCILTGTLIVRSGYFPKMLGVLVVAAGPAYLIGSYTQFLFPDVVDAVSVIYIVPLVSEVALCLWLLFKGVNIEKWNEKVGISASV